MIHRDNKLDYMKAVRAVYTAKDKYLMLMIRATLFAGVSMLLVYILAKTYFPKAVIPTGVHAAVGLILGAVLMFRVNTSYDRWYEGRKLLDDIKMNFRNVRSDNVGLKKAMKVSMLQWSRGQVSADEALHAFDMRARSEWNRDRCFEIYKAMCKCDRITSTPIPFSFRAHIKLSLFAYMVTLPMGVLHDAGIFAVPLGMVVYYVVMGFEVFSAEIEDPFRGDPNDFDVVAEIDSLDDKDVSYSTEVS